MDIHKYNLRAKMQNGYEIKPCVKLRKQNMKKKLKLERKRKETRGLYKIFVWQPISINYTSSQT